MQEIHAYQTSDGRLFTDKKQAQDHETDLLGQEIDGLLRLYELDISRNQEFKGCLSVLGKRAELKAAALAILAIFEHSEE